MDTINSLYDFYKNTPSDINEHFPVLKKYAEKSDIVYEFGVRSIVSTWALLAGHPKKMVSVDIYHPNFYGGDLERVYTLCKQEKIGFSFILGSTLDSSLNIEEADLLFIDTIHTYEQVTKELEKHSSKIKKYIIFHDTELPEMKKAIDEFISNYPEWQIREIYTNNNGLTVLERMKK